MAEELEINEEQRSYLLTNAEALVFVDGKETVDKYKCLNCGTIAIKHQVTNCKHVFCWNCIKELFHKPCPSCSVEIAEVMKDAQFEKGLLELNVECLYKNHGCQEILSLHKYQEHNLTCQMLTKELLPKLYGGQSQNEKLKQLEEDLQMIKSDVTDIREEQLKIASQNIEKLKPIQEDYEKLKSMQEDYENLKSIQEDYEKLKSIQEDYEKLKTKHHDSEEMIHQLQKEMEARKEFEQKTSGKNSANQERVSELLAGILSILNVIKPKGEETGNDDEQVLKSQGKTSVDPDELICNGKVLICTINGFNEKLQNMKVRLMNHLLQGLDLQQPRPPLHHLSLLSQRVNFTNLGLQFSVNIKFTEAYITIDLNGFQSITMFSHARKFTLADQSTQAEKTHVSFVDVPLFSRNSDFKRPYFRNNNLAPISLLEKHFQTFVKDNSLLIEIQLIPLAIMYKSVASSNGTLFWRIDNYKKKKQEEIEGLRQCLISESFYTAPQGYRAHASLYLNGNGNAKGKCISIYVDFVKGEFDNSLPSPFTAMVKFFLRDQSGSSNRQQQYGEIMFSHTEGGPHHGIDEFVSRSQAEVPSYLKEDALLFKIMIKIL